MPSYLALHSHPRIIFGKSVAFTISVFIVDLLKSTNTSCTSNLLTIVLYRYKQLCYISNSIFAYNSKSTDSNVSTFPLN